jgi:DtxR family Mn-dependent transcriptional regulator
MYLLRTALLQRDGQPVPLTQLAQELAVSPVSANEMCRKLMGEGLLTYTPYKGVTLTDDGERVAHRILRRRRLWEVFLVDQLRLAPDEADALACRLEHVTPDEVADRLAAFLGHPTHSPQHEPIPPGDDGAPPPQTCPLLSLSVGECAQIADVSADALTTEFLRTQGLVPGALITVQAVTTNGAFLLDLVGQPLGVTRSVAQRVSVVQVKG